MTLHAVIQQAVRESVEASLRSELQRMANRAMDDLLRANLSLAARLEAAIAEEIQRVLDEQIGEEEGGGS